MLIYVKTFFHSSVLYVRLGQFVWRASPYKRDVKQEAGVAALESHITSWLTAEPVLQNKRVKVLEI